MRENGALADDARAYVDDVEGGLASRTDLFSGAEIAGLVRAAASRALAQGSPTVSKAHLEEALQDITPAATRADGDLARRAPHGLLGVAERIIGPGGPRIRLHRARRRRGARRGAGRRRRRRGVPDGVRSIEGRRLAVDGPRGGLRRA